VLAPLEREAASDAERAMIAETRADSGGRAGPR
jgi:hypothetical protein